MTSGRNLRADVLTGLAAVAVLLGLVVMVGGRPASADTVTSAASDPNSGDYTCVNAFPSGATFQLRAEFPGGEPDVGETVTYGVLYNTNGTVSFTGNWNVTVRLPDGSTASGGSTGVTVPTGAPVGTVAYVVPAGAEGSTLTAWIAEVSVTNTANNTTVTCTATGSPSTVEVTVAVPPDTEPPDTEPPDTEPPDTEPPDTEPPGTDPTDTDPTGTDDSETTTTDVSTTTRPATSGQLPATGPGLTSLTSALLGGLLLAAGGLALRLARRG